MMINITYRTETIGFLEFSSVLNIHEYLKEKLCNRNAEVTSMSSLSHLVIRWLLLCNKLKLAYFTKITSMNDC